ncbi:hypothetical protein [Bradyrhizobium cenepequi]|uniref:hypothetical protein n=1 Tax=Bradyrhizobium cenepequi TaxID=2821403 RepID=UPI001CE35DF1|nr:hypothetical protein [Bradyrhizobium cenepequi]MCA6107115.1 hypothetical protein [Bradyrhizobium cenepequi]
MAIAARRLPRDGTIDVVNRLRHVLTQVNLDCKCQDSLAGALDRFATLERRRFSRRQLVQARECRNSIAAFLSLLSELDELAESEPDRTAFKEMELLFSEIVDCAFAGALALRQIATE